MFRQNAKHAYCGYSHVCCNYCSCYAALFLRHSTNMLHISHLSWLQAHHCKQHLLHLPPTTNGVHPPVNSSIWWGMIAQQFMHDIMTPSWCFPKQEMKSSYMRNFHAVFLRVLFSCKWKNKQKLHLTIAKHQHCCHTVNFSNNKVRPTHNDNSQVVCVIEQGVPDVLK